MIERNISVRGTIPVIAIFIIIATILASYSVSRDKSYTNIHSEIQRKIRNRLSYIQGISEQFIALNLEENLNQIISSVSSEPDMKSIMVLDKNGKVLVSNNYSDTDRDWRDLSIRLDPELVSQARQDKAILVKNNIDKQYIEGYISVCPKSGGLLQRSYECGVAIYRVDLAYHYDRTNRLLGNISVYFIIGTSLAVLATFILLHMLVNIPVKKAISSLHKFNQGEHDTRIQLGGSTEFTNVAHAINFVLDTVTANEKALRDKEERLSAVFNTTIDAILTIDGKGMITYVNPATERLLGYPADELVGQNVSIITPQPHREQHDSYIKHYFDTGEKKVIGKKRELSAVTRDGREVSIELSVTEMILDGQVHFTGVLHDISEQVKLRGAMKQINKELFESNLSLKSMVRTDGLTGLANRRYFDEVLITEVRRTLRQNLDMSLLMIDIDHFKLYNDHYGHQQGDICLQDVSRILRESFMRAGDLPARYGGEEFAVILPGTNLATAAELAEQFRERVWALEAEHKQSTTADRVTVSIGVATIEPDTSSKLGELDIIRLADMALYEAKASGRNRVCRYEGGVNVAML